MRLCNGRSTICVTVALTHQRSLHMLHCAELRQDIPAKSRNPKMTYPQIAEPKNGGFSYKKIHRCQVALVEVSATQAHRSWMIMSNVTWQQSSIVIVNLCGCLTLDQDLRIHGTSLDIGSFLRWILIKLDLGKYSEDGIIIYIYWNVM